MEPGIDRQALLVPAGTRLVHIGPSKTGTTSLQAAMWVGRDAMREQGVRYAGRKRHSEGAFRAIAGLSSPLADEPVPPPISLWEDFVADVRQAKEPRIVVSSEYLAHAREDAIRRVVDDLDANRIHVVVTLRPLGRILGSQWQQTVQAGSTTAFEAWLDHLFKQPPDQAASLWYRHRHDRLVERWARIVGRDRLTVVVVDDRDHAQVLRVFEALLGLRPGTLELQADLANRSLTLAEVEALRAFNVSYVDARLSRGLRTRVVRQGVALHMKRRQPGADEPRVEAPQWAMDRAGEVSREVVAALSTSGVRIVGDLARLAEGTTSRVQGDRMPDPQIPPAIAASMSIGVLIAGGFARRQPPDGGVARGSHESSELARVPSRRIVRTIRRRVVGSVRGRYRAGRHRVRHAFRRRSSGR